MALLDGGHPVNVLKVGDEVAGLLAGQAGEDDAASLLNQQQLVERLCSPGQAGVNEQDDEHFQTVRSGSCLALVVEIPLEHGIMQCCSQANSRVLADQVMTMVSCRSMVKNRACARTLARAFAAVQHVEKHEAELITARAHQIRSGTAGGWCLQAHLRTFHALQRAAQNARPDTVMRQIHSHSVLLFAHCSSLVRCEHEEQAVMLQGLS